MFLTLTALLTALTFSYPSNTSQYAFQNLYLSDSGDPVPNAARKSYTDRLYLRFNGGINTLPVLYDDENITDYSIFDCSYTENDMVYSKFISCRATFDKNTKEFFIGTRFIDYDYPNLPKLNYRCYAVATFTYNPSYEGYTFGSFMSDDVDYCCLYQQEVEYNISVINPSLSATFTYCLYFDFIDENTFNIVSTADSSLTDVFNNGYQSGKQNGYQEGVAEGSRTGYDSGYTNGYNQGFQDANNNPYTFTSLFGAIADTPIYILHSLLGFEVFGVSAINILMTMLTGCIAIYLIRKII